MKVKLFLFVFAVSIVLFACGGQSQRIQEPSESTQDQVPVRPYAELQVPLKVDLGVFEDGQMVKESTIQLTNTGTDTLHILGAQPDCYCTQIVYFDSVIPAGQRGRLTFTQDLSDFPADTIRKEFGIISNDRREQVKHITIVGVKR